jgi:hypothetical protein
VKSRATRHAMQLAVCDLGPNVPPEGSRRNSIASILPNGITVRFIVRAELAETLGRDLIELSRRTRETDPLDLPPEAPEHEFRIYVSPTEEMGTP